MDKPQRMGFIRATHDEENKYRGDEGLGSNWPVSLDTMDPREGPDCIHMLSDKPLSFHDIMRECLSYDAQEYPEGFGFTNETLALDLVTGLELGLIQCVPLRKE